MSEPVKIELTFPIKAHGEEVRELTIRRPTVADLKATDHLAGEFTKSAKMVERLAALPPSGVDQIDGADFKRITEVVDGFLGMLR